MNDPTTERLTLEIGADITRLSMRGKTIIVVSRHSFDFTGQGGGHATLHSETQVGSVSWPLPPKEAGQVWNELFKEVPDARN